MQPLVLGHRGASAYATDNSIEAFELAVAQGADGVELDVRFTADGAVVLHHDPDIGEMGPLVHHDFVTVRATHPELATLDEALEVLGDLIINVEIKNSPVDPDFDPDQDMAEAVAHWVARHDIHERVLVTSFNPAAVAAVRRSDPDIVTGQLFDAGFDFDRDLDRVRAEGHSWVAPIVDDVMTDAAGCMTAAHKAGLRVVVWTVDDAEAIRTLTAAGTDAIITNDPAETLRVLRSSPI